MKHLMVINFKASLIRGFFIFYDHWMIEFVKLSNRRGTLFHRDRIKFLWSINLNNRQNKGISIILLMSLILASFSFVLWSRRPCLLIRVSALNISYDHSFLKDMNIESEQCCFNIETDTDDLLWLKCSVNHIALKIIRL